MRAFNRVPWILALTSALAAPAAAQGNTEELLDRAVQLYEDVQIERALALLRQVVSPGSPFEVSRAQRVKAYTYIGAALALQNLRDSAIVYFRAALERDPFTDLDPRRFTEQELAAFAEAKRRTFAIAVRIAAADTIDPRTERLPITVVTTHAAGVTAGVRAAADMFPEPVFSGDVNGVGELPWNGIRASGRLLGAGRYEIIAVGESRVTQRVDTARAWIDVRLDHPPLEDTLPALRAAELLPERHPRGAAPRELGKGLLVAAAALALPSAIGHRSLEDGENLAAAAAGAGAIVGIWGFVAVRRNVAIPENVAANRLRRAERAAANAEIRKRNEERLLQTRLIIAPAAGLGSDP